MYEFVDQFSHENSFGFKAGSEAVLPFDAISGQSDVFEPYICPLSYFHNAPVDEKSSILDELQNAIEWDVSAYCAVLFDCANDAGFIEESTSEIVLQYENILDIELDEDKLEHVRSAMMNSKSLLGFGSSGTKENKLICARYYRKYEVFNELGTSLNGIKAWARDANEQGYVDVAVKLADLANKVFLLDSRKKRLTPNRVKNLMDCDIAEAELLLEGYHKLPPRPFTS